MAGRRTAAVRVDMHVIVRVPAFIDRDRRSVSGWADARRGGTVVVLSRGDPKAQKDTAAVFEVDAVRGQRIAGLPGGDAVAAVAEPRHLRVSSRRQGQSG